MWRLFSFTRFSDVAVAVVGVVGCVVGGAGVVSAACSALDWSANTKLLL